MADASLPDVRSKNPKFTSKAIEAFLLQAHQTFKDPDISTLLSNCLTNTLDNTVYMHNVDSADDLLSLQTYIVTGDIQAMWLRDSMNQVIPYFYFIQKDGRLYRLLVGLANTQAQMILLDAFANAFEVPGGESSTHGNDITHSYQNKTDSAMVKGVYERKFEADSLTAFFKLIRLIFTHASSEQVSELKNPLIQNWIPALTRALEVLNAYAGSMASVTNPDNPYYYYFERPDARPLDTLLNGIGPNAEKTGMVRTLFRPSDDACTLPFNIPVNLMLVSELQQLSPLLSQYAPAHTTYLTTTIKTMIQRIMSGIHKYGMTATSKGSAIYAYEVDGFGKKLFMDDANVPSLLSLPHIATFTLIDKERYAATRTAILNPSTNPWYFVGQPDVHSGVGSPHTGMKRIWPLSLITQMITSENQNETIDLLQALKASAMQTGLIHESYASNNYEDITRTQFAWANAAFSEGILLLLKKNPSVIEKNSSQQKEL